MIWNLLIWSRIYNSKRDEDIAARWKGAIIACWLPPLVPWRSEAIRTALLGWFSMQWGTSYSASKAPRTWFAGFNSSLVVWIPCDFLNTHRSTSRTIVKSPFSFFSSSGSSGMAGGCAFRLSGAIRVAPQPCRSSQTRECRRILRLAYRCGSACVNAVNVTGLDLPKIFRSLA